MAEARRSLGRGLSALIGEAAAPAGEPGHAAGALSIALDAISPNPLQPRRRFDQAELEALAQSIGQNGVLQPILVRAAAEGGGYEIVAGERRWRAAQMAGERAIPALVRSYSDAEAIEIAIVENVQRADLSAVEEAEGFKALAERFGRTQAQIAATVGKSREHVANALRLLQLPASVQTMVREGRLTAGHARALVGLPNAARLAEDIAERGLSVRQAEALAKPDRGGPAAPKRRGAKDADTASLEADLSEALGLKVEIRGEGAAGELRVRYQNLEQLDEVCRRLTRR